MNSTVSEFLRSNRLYVIILRPYRFFHQSNWDILYFSRFCEVSGKFDSHDKSPAAQTSLNLSLEIKMRPVSWPWLNYDLIIHNDHRRRNICISIGFLLYFEYVWGDEKRYNLFHDQEWVLKPSSKSCNACEAFDSFVIWNGCVL